MADDYNQYYAEQGLVFDPNQNQYVKPSYTEPSSPEEIAAYRTFKSVKHEKSLPVNDDRYKYFGPDDPDRPSYIMEPNLLEAQQGMTLPTGVYQDAGGGLFYRDNNEPVPIVKRPGLLPIAQTPEGVKFAAPKLLDLVGNVMAPLAAGRVPVQAGEMVLGSGMVKIAPEALKTAEPFYSALERAVSNAKVEKAAADQWLGYLKNQPGVKAEELSTVLKELPEGQISKVQLEDLVKQNKVELKEKVLGNNNDIRRLDLENKVRNGTASKDETKEFENILDTQNNPTKYHNYQLPGGENYKEMLLQLPEKEKVFDEKGWGLKDLANYKSSHWDEPNVLAHIRMNDRTIEGKKVLHLEEWQSDLHQATRDYGYKGEKAKLEPKFNKIEKKIVDSNDDVIMGQPDIKDTLKMAVDKNIITKEEAQIYDRYSKVEAGEAAGKTVPDMPFKKNWEELALKRAVRHAAENGYEGISWAPGEYQALRYQNEIRQKINSVEWEPRPKYMEKYHSDNIKEDVKHIVVDGAEGKPWFNVDKNGTVVSASYNGAKGKSLDEVLGKDFARQILEKREGNIDAKGYVMGAEGMKQAYDKRGVDIMNALGKKYGAKVEQKELPNSHKYDIRRTGDEYDEEAGRSVFHVFKDGGTHKTFKTRIEAQNYIDNAKGQPIHYLPITPQLRNKAMQEGFPLFSASPTYIPVDKPPELEKKYKLIPVENPFK